MTRISTFSAAALGLLTAVGCTYDDSELREQLADHEQRISAVEEAVDRLDSLYSSGAMITSITAMEDNAGWTLQFSNGESLNVMNGTAGAAGADGKDGNTPKIEVRTNEDGTISIWVDYGEGFTDTGINIKGDQGVPGEDGQDGTPLKLEVRTVDGVTSLWYNVTAGYPEEGWIDTGLDISAIGPVRAFVDNGDGTVTVTMNDDNSTTYVFEKASSAVRFEIMETEGTVIPKGASSTVMFRVNPSTGWVPMDGDGDMTKWTLDSLGVAVKSDYTHPSSIFSITSVVRDGDNAGQYVATISNAVEDAPDGQYDLALVLNTGSDEQPVLVSSSPFKVVLTELPAMKFTIDLTEYAASKTYTLPFPSSYRDVTGDYTLTVDWGDGSSLTIEPNSALSTSGDVSAQLTHDYSASESNTFTITIVSSETDYSKVQMPAFKPGSNRVAANNKLKIKSMDTPVLNMGQTSWASAFNGCEKLTSVPEDLLLYNSGLTALNNLFQNCKALQSVPEDIFSYVPEVTNFQHVFNGCAALKSVPAGLFAANKAAEQFNSCFQNCTALTSLPASLFAENTKATNFSLAFNGCTGLKTLPANLFANNWNVTAFAQTFKGCTGLTSIPGDLFKNNTEVTTFNDCFNGNTSLISVPEGLFAGSVSATNFSNCFMDCTSLKEVPAGLFRNAVAGERFEKLFAGCTSLSEIPAGLFANNAEMANVSYMFDECTALTAVPAGLFDNNTKITNISYLFQNCAGIKEIPSGLFKNQTEVTNANYAFYGCSAITAIPAGLFDGMAKVTRISNTFKGCTGITAIPAGLFDKNTEVTDFSSAFEGCTAITAIPEKLFVNNTKAYGFSLTFLGCTNAKINATIFCAEETEEAMSARFSALTSQVNFSRTFENCGTAAEGNVLPQLWKYTYGTRGVRSNNAFLGVTNAANSSEIPEAWGGTAKTE